jgi:hypothetical protein
MGNYVIGVGNYVIATPSELRNYEIADKAWLSMSPLWLGRRMAEAIVGGLPSRRIQRGGRFRLVRCNVCLQFGCQVYGAGALHTSGRPILGATSAGNPAAFL